MIAAISDRDAVLWVVAGCLFEVSMPAAAPGDRWRWLDPGPEVTLLEQGPRGGRHHFRFRAEAAGAGAGEVGLWFAAEARGQRRGVTVRIAPEHVPPAGAPG